MRYEANLILLVFAHLRILQERIDPFLGLRRLVGDATDISCGIEAAYVTIFLLLLLLLR